MWQNAFILAASAVVIGVWKLKPSTRIQFSGGAKYPKTPQPSTVFGPTEMQDYRRDGFLLKKGLLRGSSLEQLMKSAEEVYHSTQPGGYTGSYFRTLKYDLWRQNDEFAQVAFEELPSVAAELMEFSEEENTIRILKDGFFGFQKKNDSGCGFHVDDRFFWPASYESTGVNFWIALSPMKISEGGGIRVVNQSKVESIFEECRGAIDKVGESGFQPTCKMEQQSPECHEKMLEASVVFDMEPGDALIWDRWTFHRSEPFAETTAEDDKEYRLRYTIRYVPGTAKASGVHHPSQPTGEIFDSPYYPRVWPTAAKSEIKAIQWGLDD